MQHCSRADSTDARSILPWTKFLADHQLSLGVRSSRLKAAEFPSSVEGVGKRLQLCMGLRCQVQLEAMDQLGWTALLHACRNDMTEARRLTV